MANTITGLLPDLYEALDVVSRELTGFLGAMTVDARAARAKKDQEITVPITPAAAAEDVTPGQLPPDTGDQTIDPNTKIKISKSRAVPFRWDGEEQRGLNTGVGYANIRRDQIAQALRTLVNEAEADAAALYYRASRAFGTAGTTPFASDLEAAAEIKKILDDNGCPMGDRHLVIDTSAGAKMRKLTQLTKANEAGNDSPLRQGVLLDLFGFAIRESAQTKYHTKGTAATYNSDLVAGYSIGDTSIHLEAGTGDFAAGDVVTFAGDANKYLAAAAVPGDGDIDLVINKPGLRLTLANDVNATVGNSFRANVAFHRSAMVFVARPPALPEEGDAASDRQLITDPRTGLTFEISMYPQYRRVRYEVALAWGVAAIKPEHMAVLLG